MDDRPDISPDAFRTAMRRLASGVVVITSDDGETTAAMTATAVCSVSADPPTALVCVNREARSHAVIARSGVFAVNVLSADQHALAALFASKAGKAPDDYPHVIGATGCVLLAGTRATFECRVSGTLDVASHTLFIGRVVSAVSADRPPLIYDLGAFTTTAS